MSRMRTPEGLDTAPVLDGIEGDLGRIDAAAAAPREHAAERRSAAPVPHAGSQLMERLLVWEELLTLIVDRDSPQVQAREQRLLLLDEMLRRAQLDPAEFWRSSPAQRGRAFLACYSRSQRSVPQLEITSFDVDKAAKERFRSEPLTLGAAWHYGLWRSYFSHAAITHPANDGLREEFSTAWDIQRKEPVILERGPEGPQLLHIPSVHLDLPILVGPLPHSDGVTMERAYLAAIAQADSGRDLHVATRVIVDSAAYRAHAGFYRESPARNPPARPAGGIGAQCRHPPPGRLGSGARGGRGLSPGRDRSARGCQCKRAARGSRQLARRACESAAKRLLALQPRFLVAAARGSRGTRRGHGARARRRREVLPAHPGGGFVPESSAAALPGAAGLGGRRHGHARVRGGGLRGDPPGRQWRFGDPSGRTRPGTRVLRSGHRCRSPRGAGRARQPHAGRTGRTRALVAHLLAALDPRLPLLHGDRRRAEDLGQHYGDHRHRGLGAERGCTGDPRVRAAESRPESPAGGRRTHSGRSGGPIPGLTVAARGCTGRAAGGGRTTAGAPQRQLPPGELEPQSHRRSPRGGVPDGGGSLSRSGRFLHRRRHGAALPRRDRGPGGARARRGLARRAAARSRGAGLHQLGRAAGLPPPGRRAARCHLPARARRGGHPSRAQVHLGAARRFCDRARARGRQRAALPARHRSQRTRSPCRPAGRRPGARHRPRRRPRAGRRCAARALGAQGERRPARAAARGCRGRLRPRRRRDPRTRLHRTGQPREHQSGGRERGLPHVARRGERRAVHDLVGRGRPAAARSRGDALGVAASRFGALRHHRRRPAPGARRGDQDQSGSQAWKGRPARRPEGHADGEPGPQHPGWHRRALTRSQARHLLDRRHAGRGMAVAAVRGALWHQDHRLHLHEVRCRRHVVQLRGGLPAGGRRPRRFGQLPRRLLPGGLAGHLPHHPAHAPRPGPRAALRRRHGGNPSDPGLERARLRGRRRHAAAGLRRLAR